MGIITKKREVVVNNDWTEAGDLANEIGKIYMQDLNEFIERSRKHDRTKLYNECAIDHPDKFYFIVKIEKDPTNLKNIEIRMALVGAKFKNMFESTDFWEYDYRKEKRTLLWSVPSRIDMKNFLRAEHKYSKDLIRWIKLYLKDNPEINLNDKSRVILS